MPNKGHEYETKNKKEGLLDRSFLWFVYSFQIEIEFEIVKAVVILIKYLLNIPKLIVLGNFQGSLPLDI